MLLLNILSEDGQFLLLEVSILVLMDVAFEWQAIHTITRAVLLFQSLFLWMLLLNLYANSVLCCGVPVSILVLMDVAFEY